MEQRECGPEVQDLFFADDGSNIAHTFPRVIRAKAICAQCPVRKHCLVYALRGPYSRLQTYHVWGGLTYFERLLFYRRRKNRIDRRRLRRRQHQQKVLA